MDREGVDVGTTDGSTDVEGLSDASFVGCIDASTEGVDEGTGDGPNEGCCDGALDGPIDVPAGLVIVGGASLRRIKMFTLKYLNVLLVSRMALLGSSLGWFRLC